MRPRLLGLVGVCLSIMDVFLLVAAGGGQRGAVRPSGLAVAE
ncbi:hypothetical protein [Micromonospora luteifusca]